MTIILSLLLLLLAAFLVFSTWPGKKPAESITVWYAVDADGTAFLFTARPQRDTTLLVWTVKDVSEPYLKADSLKGILPPLTWADEPIMVCLSPSGRSDLNASES